MANLIIQENNVERTLPAVHGEEITIKAPCNCSDVTGVQIAGVAYPFYDAAGKPMEMGTGLFSKDNLIRVLIDTENTRATIINHAIPDQTLRLNEPPNYSTVGKIGQHAIYNHKTYVCVAHITNGNEIKYIWHHVLTEKAQLDLVIITTTQTLDISTLGLDVGDKVTVACVSGGNGGKKAGGAGGAAGKGGSASGTSSSFGGGGGAGAGYGAGGGGGGGNGTNNMNNTGGQGGQGGNCEIGTYEITSTSVSVTIGAAGTASGGTGGTTSFGSYVSVTGGGGSAGGSGGNGTSMNPGGGGGGGGGWYLVEGNTSPTHYGAGSNGVSYSAGRNGGNGGGYGNGAGAGGAAGKNGGDTTIGAGHGVVYIWY